MSYNVVPTSFSRSTTPKERPVEVNASTLRGPVGSSKSEYKFPNLALKTLVLNENLTRCAPVTQVPPHAAPTTPKPWFARNAIALGGRFSSVI